jgi:hypothetical protein
MVPQVDQLVAALVAWAVGLLAGALVRWPAWPVRAIGAGVVGYAALFVSYGAAAFLCVAAGLCAGLCGADRRSLIHATRVVGLAALAATAVLALSVAFGHRPIDAFRASMAIHFGSFTLARSYWSWLLFGPWDLAIFLGAPIAMLFGSRIARGIAELVRTGASSLRDPTHRGLLAFAAALVALFLSGTLRGEVGRSAMPLMSLCLAASLLPAPETAGGARNEPTGAPAARFATLLAALLLLSCWVLRASWV